MKKILIVPVAALVLFSCGDASDGDASTDTTNFNTPADTSSTGLYGDTSVKMDPSTQTDTFSRPYSGATTGTGDTGTKKSRK